MSEFSQCLACDHDRLLPLMRISGASPQKEETEATPHAADAMPVRPYAEVLCCPECQHAQVECYDTLPEPGYRWYLLHPGNADVLRQLLKQICPQPQNTACPCSVHQAMRAFLADMVHEVPLVPHGDAPTHYSWLTFEFDLDQQSLRLIKDESKGIWMRRAAYDQQQRQKLRLVYECAAALFIFYYIVAILVLNLLTQATGYTMPGMKMGIILLAALGGGSYFISRTRRSPDLKDSAVLSGLSLIGYCIIILGLQHAAGLPFMPAIFIMQLLTGTAALFVSYRWLTGMIFRKHNS